MAVHIRPLHDRLIVQRIDDGEQKSAGGIIIPDSAKEKPQEGKVLAVGKGKKACDRILFGKYSGSEIKVEGEECLILREDEVLGVIES